MGTRDWTGHPLAQTHSEQQLEQEEEGRWGRCRAFGGPRLLPCTHSGGLAYGHLNQERGELETCRLPRSELGRVPALRTFESRQRNSCVARSGEYDVLGGVQNAWSNEDVAPEEGFLEEARSWQVICTSL